MTEVSDLFGGARRKIKRAEHHVIELNDLLNTFLKSDFYSISVQPHDDPRRNVWKFTMRDLPEDIPLVIGDALHNLRSALDYVASDIARSIDSPGKYIKFPARKTRDEVKAAVNGGEIKAAHPDIIKAILDEVKPYEGGNDSLYALHELDICDKHILLIPIVSVASVTFDAVVGAATFRNCTVAGFTGNEANIVSFPSSYEIQGQMQPSFVVKFAQGQPLQGQAVVPTLHQLSQIVTDAVNIIAKACIASAKKQAVF